MIYDYLRELKKSAGNPPNAQISEKSGVPESTVSKLMAGTYDNPRFDNVANVVIALGGSLDELMGIVRDDKEPVAIENPLESIGHMIALQRAVGECRPLPDDERQHYRDRIQTLTDAAAEKEERIRAEYQQQAAEMQKIFWEREAALKKEYAEREQAIQKDIRRREGLMITAIALLVTIFIALLIIDMVCSNIGFIRRSAAYKDPSFSSNCVYEDIDV